jgi:hypothetical protein
VKRKMNKLLLPATAVASLCGLLALAPSSAQAGATTTYTFDTSTPGVSGTLILNAADVAQAGSFFTDADDFIPQTWSLSGLTASLTGGSPVLSGHERALDTLQLEPFAQGNPPQEYSDEKGPGEGAWVSDSPVSPVPETAANPVLIALAGVGVVGIGMVRRLKISSMAK